jgi:hypothetical protein
MLMATCLPSSSAASSRNRQGAHLGLIVASNVYLSAEPFESVAALADAMQRLRQPQPIRACCGGAWRVHFAAQLERPVDDAVLELEFVDVSRVGQSELRRRVFSSVVAGRPGQPTVFVEDFVITAAQGFAAHHNYEVSLWRRVGTTRIPLAKGRFVLMS